MCRAICPHSVVSEHDNNYLGTSVHLLLVRTTIALRYSIDFQYISRRIRKPVPSGDRYAHSKCAFELYSCPCRRLTARSQQRRLAFPRHRCVGVDALIPVTRTLPSKYGMLFSVELNDNKSESVLWGMLPN